MRTLVELNSTGQFDTDKGTAHSYLELYDQLFAPMQAHADVLEIGVFRGGSLKLWEAYFATGNILGLDLVCPVGVDTDRIKVFACDGTSQTQLDSILENRTFDIIIDDGSHAIGDQATSLRLLTGRLRPGGYYIIEDVLDAEDLVRLHQLCPAGFKSWVADLRCIKDRWDDILVIYRRLPPQKQAGSDKACPKTVNTPQTPSGG